MPGYEHRRIAANVSRHTVRPRPVPTLDVIAADVWRVTLSADGLTSVSHVLAFNTEHAIEVAMGRYGARAGKVTAIAALAPCHGLDEMETKIALMAGETEAEKADRLVRFQRMPESVL